MGEAVVNVVDPEMGVGGAVIVVKVVDTVLGKLELLEPRNQTLDSV